MSTKNPNDPNGIRIHDLPACSTVPQPTVPLPVQVALPKTRRKCENLRLQWVNFNTESVLVKITHRNKTLNNKINLLHFCLTSPFRTKQSKDGTWHMFSQ